MLIEMNRFLTRGEIERLYQMPPEVLRSVMANVRVAYRDESGEERFAESHIDRAVDDFPASATGSQPRTCKPAPKGKPGRPNTTADIALVANDLKAQGKTWKEVLAACKSRFPGRVKSVEQVRTIWRRRFGGKK
jgi:hypothetical protein